MIKLNTPYKLENGDHVVFTEGKKGTINGKHSEATLTGTLAGNVLKATFHNTKVNATGLMEITFLENGFDAKWKSGLEPGPMRGKWVGVLKGDGNKPVTKSIENLTDKQKEYLEEGVNYEDFDAEYHGDDDEKVEWMKEKAFLMEAVKQDERILKHASDELKADRELVLEAIKNDISAIDYADGDLQGDPEILAFRIDTHFRGDNNIEITVDDLSIFTTDNRNPSILIEKLLFKVEFLFLKNTKEEFKEFHKKLIDFINANHECYWILIAVSKRIDRIYANVENYIYSDFADDQAKSKCEELEELRDIITFDIDFKPEIEFETYFNDSEIRYDWNACKWSNQEDEEGLPFTEFIMNQTDMEWDDDSWSDSKYYNHAISRLWIGLQNYALKQSNNGFDEEEFAILFHEVIEEKYEPIQDSGNGHYGSFAFETVVEYLLGLSQNDFNLNESYRDDLEDFNGWQYDLKRIGLKCDCDLFDDWPGASEFAKR